METISKRRSYPKPSTCITLYPYFHLLQLHRVVLSTRPPPLRHQTARPTREEKPLLTAVIARTAVPYAQTLAVNRAILGCRNSRVVRKYLAVATSPRVYSLVAHLRSLHPIECIATNLSSTTGTMLKGAPVANQSPPLTLTHPIRAARIHLCCLATHPKSRIRTVNMCMTVEREGHQLLSESPLR